MLKIFNPTTAVALQHFSKEENCASEGTQNFISLFSKLWKILDNRDIFKHVKLRDKDRKPISSLTDKSAVFIKNVIEWLVKWKSLSQAGGEGGLSRETHTALLHTMKVFLELIPHFLSNKGYSYLLIGKFQTDPLERRFSKYRSMSGTNYHVAVVQILQSEKKLKVLSALKILSKTNSFLTLKEKT